MENLELNKQEKKELEKRGFFVKKGKKIQEFILLILIHGWYLFIGMFPLLLISTIPMLLIKLGIINLLVYKIIIAIAGIFLLKPIGRLVIAYIMCGNSFYWKKGIINFGYSFINYKEARKSKLYRYMEIIKNQGFMSWFLVIFFSIWMFIFGSGIFLAENENISPESYLINFIILLTLYSSIILILRAVFQSFHPLYAFGNLGEKIQKLTPRIEEQSQKIQSEFQSDMNFSVLSNGFDSLSTTFTDIVTLVIKLEKVEARANKGNLFDSEKYINSLRSDIVTPLTSLKTFLEKQKIELLESQKELNRVRVGGSEGTGNIELQSKRSESLINELTENIEKLDVMIGKMG